MQESINLSLFSHIYMGAHTIIPITSFSVLISRYYSVYTDGHPYGRIQYFSIMTNKIINSPRSPASNQVPEEKL